MTCIQKMWKKRQTVSEVVTSDIIDYDEYIRVIHNSKVLIENINY